MPAMRNGSPPAGHLGTSASKARTFGKAAQTMSPSVTHPHPRLDGTFSLCTCQDSGPLSATAQRSTWSSLGLTPPLLNWDLVTSLQPHTAPSKIHVEGCSQPLLCTRGQGRPLELLLLWWQVVKGRVCGCACAHACTARPRSRKEQVAPPGPQAICSAPGTRCSSLASSINLQLTSRPGPAMQTSDRFLLPFRPQMALIPCLSQPSEGSRCIHPCPRWVRRGQAGLPAKPRGLNPGSHIPPPYWHQVRGPGAGKRG